MVKGLNVYQVEKQVRTPKREKSSAEQSHNDGEIAEYCKCSYERRPQEDGIHLEIEDLKEVVKKMKTDTGVQNKLFLA